MDVFWGHSVGKISAEASSFVAAGPAPLKPWLHVADRSWSPGRTEVGACSATRLAQNWAWAQKLGHCHDQKQSQHVRLQLCLSLIQIVARF